MFLQKCIIKNHALFIVNLYGLMAKKILTLP